MNLNISIYIPNVIFKTFNPLKIKKMYCMCVLIYSVLLDKILCNVWATDTFCQKYYVV